MVHAVEGTFGSQFEIAFFFNVLFKTMVFGFEKEIAIVVVDDLTAEVYQHFFPAASEV